MSENNDAKKFYDLDKKFVNNYITGGIILMKKELVRRKLTKLIGYIKELSVIEKYTFQEYLETDLYMNMKR